MAKSVAMKPITLSERLSDASSVKEPNLEQRATDVSPLRAYCY